MKTTPPKLLRSLLYKCCNTALWESIEGDLTELFFLDLKKKGKRKAQINYFLNALAFLRYHRLRKRQNSKTLNHMGLIKNYLKVSYRDLKRNKTFTGINLFGLVAGMTVSLLMFQYVLFETSFDDFNKDTERIYRVINDRYQNGELVQHGAITYPTIGPTMKADFPEIESYTRMTFSGSNFINYENETFRTGDYLIADEHFLTFFDYELLKGQKEECLDAAFKMVLTKQFAEKLIKKGENVTDLIGRPIHFNYEKPFMITGILENPPANSHLQFSFITSYKSFIAIAGEEVDNSWEWSDFYHYIKLKEGVKKESLDGKLADFGKRYFKEGEVSGGDEKFFLQSLKEIHLDDSMEYEIGVVTNGNTVWLMLYIAIFIVVIAWINYINLNTSRAIQRAKEVGIRKSVGALKGQIIRQSFTETLLMNLIALITSIGLVILLQPAFNNLTGLELSMSIVLFSSIWGIPFPLLLFATLLVSLAFVALYPALLVTRFSTQDVLKGSFKLKGEIAWLRKGMVVFQFSLAVILITATIAIARQIEFMVNQDLGVDVDNTMVVYGPVMTNWDSTFINKIDLFKKSLSSLSGIEGATISNRVPGSLMGRIFQVTSKADPEAQNLTSNFINVDHDFSELYDLEFITGRDFGFTDHDLDGSKVKNIVINESAVPLLKFDSPENAIGQSINFWNKDWTIIGVIKDFHQQSLHKKIEPIFLIPYYDTGNNFSIKFSSQVTPALVEAVEKRYDQHFPGNYFDYYFLTDEIKSLYDNDVRVSRVSNVFAALSIIIAVLGLYGLVMITLVRKTKEIGIRKVLGANLGQLLRLMSKEFLLLVFIAVLIGAPMSYLILMEWKAGFAYSIHIGFGLIFISSFLLILISTITIGFQTKKITKNNPVESLRWE
ncbi:ABC transporter permease [Ekhidna sp. To15]|uniref:ABC transporter permease n=1 Tax=Ekhidna sp. To15 TaxID=3395267 RepID=UPI003F51B75F